MAECITCGRLAFQHDPGPCNRSKSEKEDTDQIDILKNSILNEILEEKIKMDSKDREASATESLVEALKSVVNTRPTQITKAKKPPVWNKESFDDFKIEVEAWNMSHSGDEYVKYEELMEKLKENKNIKGLADFACTVLIQRTREKKNVEEVLKVLEEKYALTRKEKYEKVVDLIKKFQNGAE